MKKRGPYSILRDGIPFQLMGFTWDELHAMWEWQQRRTGLAALALLLMVPQDEAGATYDYEELLGMRQAWMESAAASDPREDAASESQRDGITLERLEKAVKGTHLEAAHLAGRWFHGTTGTFFLDNFIDQDEFSGYSDPWEEDTHRVRQPRNGERQKTSSTRIEHLTAWLEEDLPERFEQMLDLILERLEEIPENSSQENSSKENCQPGKFQQREFQPGKFHGGEMSETTDPGDINWAGRGKTQTERDKLKMRLDIYEENLILKCYEEDATWTRQVDANQIASSAHAVHGGQHGVVAPKRPLVEAVPGRRDHRRMAGTPGLERGPSGQSVRAAGGGSGCPCPGCCS